MTEPSELDRVAILDLIAGQDAAWCAGDAAAFGARAMADIVFTNVVGMFTLAARPCNARPGK